MLLRPNKTIRWFGRRGGSNGHFQLQLVSPAPTLHLLFGGHMFGEHWWLFVAACRLRHSTQQFVLPGAPKAIELGWMGVIVVKNSYMVADSHPFMWSFGQARRMGGNSYDQFFFHFICNHVSPIKWCLDFWTVWIQNMCRNRLSDQGWHSGNLKWWSHCQLTSYIQPFPVPSLDQQKLSSIAGKSSKATNWEAGQFFCRRLVQTPRVIL